MSRGHLVPPLGPQDLRPRTDYAAGPRVSAGHRAGSQLTRSARLPDTWLSDAARSRKPAHQVRKAARRLVKRCRDPNRRPAAAVRTESRSNCPSRTPRSRFLFLVFASKAYRRAELPFPLRPVTGHTIHIITDAFCGHLSDTVKRALGDGKTNLAVIPGGMTPTLQLIDVVLNK
ncbi:hypothetical protein HPB51_019905 [Rhipicephalus microplus]|uniref:DDE-1 domain-containing protein n=1 Tax=Rhipicephalus microplus TaxID=6941 RepID=A0A9J6E2Q3_RHIMP|nr:hypothetical protein HPB51_019905 [Rhipicephalus microplus]